jgi:crotonobetainyl-CoA:carnitine CoA-transferase CaiB-like acyl-CoA transferase
MAVTHPSPRPGELAGAGPSAAARTADGSAGEPAALAGPAGERKGPEGPLAGVHVLDLARVLAGPYAAMLLGDLGAEVIKVERPGSGDDTRQWGPPFMPAGDGAESTYFLSVNRGKRSVAIDLKDPRERAFVEALVRWADVLVENFRPGVMDRLGLGDDRLAELNPRLVRLAISGFGETGPDSDRIGYDQILQAEGGLMSLTGTAASPAVKVGVPIADVSAGLFGVIGVLGALVERASSGLGQRVSTSLLAAQVGIHTFQATRYLIAGQVPGPSGNHHPTVAPYGVFDAADGPLVIAVGNEDIWRRFAPLVGLEPADRRFATNALRLGNLAELQRILNEGLAPHTVADWLGTLRQAGVPAGELKTLDRVYGSEQARAENLVWEVDHPLLGTIRLPGNPVHYNRSAMTPGLPPPTLGEHTDALREALLSRAQADGR